MLRDFRQFLLRGNLVDLAIAVVVGTAFSAVVTALVGDLITPLIAAIGGEPDFGDLEFTINDSRFRYGHFRCSFRTEEVGPDTGSVMA